MSDAVRTPACADDERRAELALNPSPAPVPPLVELNGIDFVEVDPANHAIIRVHFLKPLPAGGYGIPADPSLVVIEGGTRIVGISVLTASVESSQVLRIEVGHGGEPPYAAFHGGDYSPYVLTLPDVAELDPVKRSTVFSFMASCPTDVDCRPLPCPPQELVEPLLDYLAKDYSSFRRLLLDLLPTLNPDWIERNPSDLGIALLELLAYEGDRLSYYQDAVANEAYLDTVRTRISARRHARLVDYRMHDGRNAWAPVHFTVSAAGLLPRGTALFTKLTAPLRGQTSPPATEIAPAAITVDDLQRDADLQGVVAFETAHNAHLYVANNTIRLHTWGDEECCLTPGTTEAYLYYVPPAPPMQAKRPSLVDGDYLVLEEVAGPRTGAAPDADPRHRQLVRIEGTPEQTTDPLYSRMIVNDLPQRRQQGQPALPLLRVRWRRADALTFPLCLSARTDNGTLVRNVSVARGNIVLADNGLTTEETHASADLTIDGRLVLSLGPLTMECRPGRPQIDTVTGRFDVDRPQLDCDVREALPALTLTVSTPTETEQWTSVPDLLSSPPLEPHFVAEIDDDGRALLRFGDDEYGRALPEDVTSMRAVYRVGSGRAGKTSGLRRSRTSPHRPAAGSTPYATRWRRRAGPIPRRSRRSASTRRRRSTPSSSER